MLSLVLNNVQAYGYLMSFVVGLTGFTALIAWLCVLLYLLPLLLRFFYRVVDDPLTDRTIAAFKTAGFMLLIFIFELIVLIMKVCEKVYIGIPCAVVAWIISLIPGGDDENPEQNATDQDGAMPPTTDQETTIQQSAATVGRETLLEQEQLPEGVWAQQVQMELESL